MRLKNWLRLLVYGAAVVLPLWAFWLEPSSLRLKEYDLPLKRWPADQAGLRIAAISDIHAGAPYIDRAKLQKIVELSNAAHPDLVLLPGDFVITGVLGGRFIAPEDSAAILAGFKAPLGVFAVMGNHDIGLDAARVSAAFEAQHISVMDNRVRCIDSGRFHFWLAGFGDYTEALDRVEKTLAGVTDDAPVLAFTHNPRLFEWTPARVNLLVGGHTHGGQVNLPFLLNWALRVPYERQHKAGHYADGNSDLFVTTGIGTSGLPVRFLAPPEISLLTVHQAP